LQDLVPGGAEVLPEALDAEITWLGSVEVCLQAIASCSYLKGDSASRAAELWLGGELPGNPVATTQRWLDHVGTLELVAQIDHTLTRLPVGLNLAATEALQQSVPSDLIWDALQRTAVETTLRSRLQADPSLAGLTAARLEAAFGSYQTLVNEKPQLVRQQVRRRWLEQQKRRFLAASGSQLNKHGASLKQRLFVKGKKALKLRQMLNAGQESAEAEQGDPLFDICPVWMASPATVAQIFPKEPIFDVVIFDEASQCRLEEALSVLLRGQRVVIAGDQKQLPPTRFFETTVAESEDVEPETAEELFYHQQKEAEDLLSAALNLSVREVYLDVHYRSKNPDLIHFSNTQFYGSRLQPIPAHPRNQLPRAPIQIHAVNGVYAERSNAEEAEAAVQLVADYLAQPEPPSIGVACFNLTQKETILEALAARCAEDTVFAERFEQARTRQGRDSFEGLFVKNLENVQGDERDVMIISTTFGPDATGRFLRNFGALSQREGGRRLNVLVTRARLEVHLLTSIPKAEYLQLASLPPGVQPNGRLLLYAYLRLAEELALASSQLETKVEAKTQLLPSATPSSVAVALGRDVLKMPTTVHWGNEGFCIDVVREPSNGGTYGVLTDFARFTKTPDPIAWDAFRSQILADTGWELRRAWSPELFRKPAEVIKTCFAEATSAEEAS
jgi:hypothetical protein